MNTNELVQRIFDHVENGDVDKAVRASLRLSRQIGDYMNTAIFLHELIDDRTEIARVIYDDTSHLKEEAQKYLFEHSYDRWLNSRTLPKGYSLPSSDGEEKNVLAISVGDFPAELEQCERSINDLTIPPTMGEFDSAAFTDRYSSVKANLRLRIRGINAIKSRILNHCLNFAIQVERQLAAQQKTKTFLETAQNEVQNYFKSRSDDVYEKLQKANQLIDSSSQEDMSLLLTQVRRAIKSVADYFYPAKVDKVKCVDGTERKLGDEQYLNRLHEFVYSTFERSTATDLLRAEFDYLLEFAKKLNDLASKGVHAEVSLAEAKQGFLGLYMFLYNLYQRLEVKQ
jgi:dsDNA-binding SOS-regulon protein